MPEINTCYTEADSTQDYYHEYEDTDTGSTVRIQLISPLHFLRSSDAKPTEAERRVWEEVNTVLKESVSILHDLQSYSGAGEAIRQASTAPVMHIRLSRHQPVLS